MSDRLSKVVLARSYSKVVLKLPTCSRLNGTMCGNWAKVCRRNKSVKLEAYKYQLQPRVNFMVPRKMASVAPATARYKRNGVEERNFFYFESLCQHLVPFLLSLIKRYLLSLFLCESLWLASQIRWNEVNKLGKIAFHLDRMRIFSILLTFPCILGGF
jgi:hypothetical protein